MAHDNQGRVISTLHVIRSTRDFGEWLKSVLYEEPSRAQVELVPRQLKRSVEALSNGKFNDQPSTHHASRTNLITVIVLLPTFSENK